MRPRPVVEGHTEQAAAGVEDLADLLVGVATAIQVELIRLVDELHHPLAVAPRPIVDRQGHPQALEESREVGALQLARHETREPPPVHGGARAILCRYGTVRKQPRQGPEKAREVVVTLRERDTLHRGERERHLRELHGVVVDEHERVRGEVEALRQLSDLRRLGVIAREYRDEIRFLQEQPSRSERRERDLGVVAAHRSQQCAFALQPAQEALLKLEDIPHFFAGDNRLAGGNRSFHQQHIIKITFAGRHYAGPLVDLFSIHQIQH